MYIKAENEWPWPEDMDALAAAPEHHTLLFENQKVRVLETYIKPGETTGLHTHQWPSTLYILSWSDFVRSDQEGTVLLDSRTLAFTPHIGAAVWSEPLAPHTLKNVGTTDMHIISVEIKQA